MICSANTGSRPVFFFCILLSKTKLDQIYQLFGPEAKNIKIWRYEHSGIWCCVAGPSSPLGIFWIWALWSFKTSGNTHPTTLSHSRRPESSATPLREPHICNIKLSLPFPYFELMLLWEILASSICCIKEDCSEQYNFVTNTVTAWSAFSVNYFWFIRSHHICNEGSKYITYIYWPLNTFHAYRVTAYFIQIFL